MSDKDQTIKYVQYWPPVGTSLTRFEKDGKHWVDTGHADVGPFDTEDEASDHIQRIIVDRITHEYANCMCVPHNHIHGCSIHEVEGETNE